MSKLYMLKRLNYFLKEKFFVSLQLLTKTNLLGVNLLHQNGETNLRFFMHTATLPSKEE